MTSEVFYKQIPHFFKSICNAAVFPGLLVGVHMKRSVVFNNSSTESNRIQSTFLILKKKRLKNAALIEWDV